MVYISSEEVLKLARLSRIELRPEEVDGVRMRLQQVLEYAACVSEVAGQTNEPSAANVNVFREDVVVATDSEKILALAPDRQDNLFVVPSIIKNN